MDPSCPSRVATQDTGFASSELPARRFSHIIKQVSALGGWCCAELYKNESLCVFAPRVLHPEYKIPCLKLWSSFYVNRYRTDHVQDAAKAAEIQALKLENEYQVLQYNQSLTNSKTRISFCTY